MDYNEKADYAAELKRSGGYNCCQAVTAVLAEETGMSERELNALAAGFAGGMGTMEATCGSLIGAVMAAGLASNGQGTVRIAKQISAAFKEMCGATICRELKGVGTGTVLCPCDECVRNAVLAYAKVMEMYKA